MTPTPADDVVAALAEARRMKRYSIKPRWFDSEIFEAETPGKAKAMAFRAAREALGRNISFRDFLDGLRVLHLGPAALRNAREGR
ncbi:hypothetical protein [Neotabrizicola sp. sgz301269]|uniref:hypothetical protein n=1 Tax=Neotabrizicola sp. sgz301269 TaxID=3276282 RepID=UPI00377007E1